MKVNRNTDVTKLFILSNISEMRYWVGERVVYWCVM